MWLMFKNSSKCEWTSSSQLALEKRLRSHKKEWNLSPDPALNSSIDSYLHFRNTGVLLQSLNLPVPTIVWTNTLFCQYFFIILDSFPPLIFLVFCFHLMHFTMICYRCVFIYSLIFCIKYKLISMFNSENISSIIILLNITSPIFFFLLKH